MSDIKSIQHPIKDELVSFEQMFRQTISSDYPMLGAITDRLLNLSGKRMRPILTLLVARLHGPISESHLAAAVIMEMTHNASLVHDDVLDEAYQRRGTPTAMALLRSKGAVLAGDYLLTNAISLGVKYGNYRAIDIAARTLRQLVEGEMQQMHHALLLDTSEADYYQIIRLKTAYLMASSAELGAPAESAETMYRFGELIGEAFQIKDDILDLVGNGTGKVLYNDLRERKITLPLIKALEHEPRARRNMMKLLRSASASAVSAQRLAEFVVSSGGVDASEAVVEAKLAEALKILSAYPACDARNSLEAYASFVSGRKY